MRAAREMSTASMSCESLINSYNAFKGSEKIAIYCFIENKLNYIEYRVIQCYSFKFTERKIKKGMCVRGTWCVDVLILMLLINYVNIVTCVNLIYSCYIDLGAANRPYIHGLCVTRTNTSKIMFYYILLVIFIQTTLTPHLRRSEKVSQLSETVYLFKQLIR